MNRRHALTLLGSTAALSACSRFATYHGPEVTRLEVYKSERLLAAFHHGEMLEVYDMNLGFAPTGHKTEYGDGRTPEGRIRDRPPQSRTASIICRSASATPTTDVATGRAAG
jgi:murein L,D-transpeptidase YafK